MNSELQELKRELARHANCTCDLCRGVTRATGLNDDLALVGDLSSRSWWLNEAAKRKLATTVRLAPAASR